MRGIFLDDERTPDQVTWIDYPSNMEWVVVRNSREFALEMYKVIASGEKYVVSFDHDLQEFYGDLEVTGYDLLQEMLYSLLDAAERDGEPISMRIPETFFHTKNPVGKENMETYLANFMKAYY